MAHILVTGGAGFIGSHLCARLWTEGHWVTCLDNFDPFYAPAIKHEHVRRLRAMATTTGRLVCREGDIRDAALLDRLFQERPIDLVVHLAALAGVRPSIERPLAYSEVNIQGTLQILECCRRFHVQQVLFGSSSSVYGARQRVPFAEDDEVSLPVSPYAATKRAGELLCYTYAHLYCLRIACLRFFTVYGPSQRPDLAIHKFARLMLAGQPIPVFGDGTTQRDYTYVDDIVEGIVRAWQWLRQAEGTAEVYDIFNLGGAHPVALLELIHHLEVALDCPAQIDWQPEQPGDVPRTYADLRKSAAVLGYRPQVALATGLQHFATWLRSVPQP